MIAVIDIGSNSVRLMLWADGKTILKRILTTRLGEGMKDCCLAQASLSRSAEAVSFFYGEAVKAGAERVYAFATAAVRKAENKGEFLDRVKELCGLFIDVVSGEEEAELAAFGALGTGDGIVLDVGGASSEVFSRSNGNVVFEKSFPIGAVTLYERCRDDQRRSEKFVETMFSDLPSLRGKVYAVGGTATALASLYLELARYDASLIQNCFLSLKELRGIKEKLFSLNVEERKRLRGMEESRADVIAGRACILTAIAEKIGSDGIYVSDRDNLEGYLCARGII